VTCVPSARSSTSAVDVVVVDVAVVVVAVVEHEPRRE